MLRIVRPQFGSPTPGRLQAAGRAKSGWAYAAYSNVRSTTFQLDLPADAEGWEKHLGSKSRKVMRWELRKFAEHGDGRIESAESPDQRATRRSTPSSGCCANAGATGEVYFAHDPEFRGFVHEAVPAMVEHGGAWVTVARDDDGIQGVLVSLAQNGYAMALTIAMTDGPGVQAVLAGQASLRRGPRRGRPARLPQLRLPVGRWLQGELLARDAAPPRERDGRPRPHRQGRGAISCAQGLTPSCASLRA